MTRSSYWYQDICPCDLDHLWNWQLSGAFVFHKHILFDYQVDIGMHDFYHAKDSEQYVTYKKYLQMSSCQQDGDIFKTGTATNVGFVVFKWINSHILSC